MNLEQQHSAPGNSGTLQVVPEWVIEEAFDLPGAYHMARDESLARERIADANLPNVLRLYSWQPFAVSIGFQQQLESVDLDACRRADVDVVRRPTGGRAVLHASELTYAAIIRIEPNQGIYAVHNSIVESLLASMEGLGPEYRTMALTGRSDDRNFQQVYKTGSLTNVACFASTARHEVTYRGKKVIGSAQRRFGDAVLQHGSILLSADHLKLPEFLALSEEQRSAMASLLRRETATLSDVFGRPITPEEAAASIGERFVTQICEHMSSELV
jgi:lipoate-protein ligase A